NAEANGIINPDTKDSVVSTTKVRNQVEIEGNLMEKKNAKENNVRKYVKNAKNSNSSSSSSSSQSNVEIKKRSLRSRLGSEVDGGFVAFTADYHSPRHHPPKNNK
ncbi:hypothetical protein PIB30_054254, partial [Stylosanthes scabra]|nr:hypothetical protein [Stylosanthes scabra]